MSFNPQASSFSSSSNFDKNKHHPISQKQILNDGYMKPRTKWNAQTSPPSSARTHVCDPLAEGRRVRVDNVFYGTRFVPEFIGAIGIPGSDIECIHSTGTSNGPSMCWVDFVSHAAASRAVQLLRAELRKWLPEVFLCSPATELSGRTTSTDWRSSDGSHTLTDEHAIDQEWHVNNMGHISPASTGSHPCLSSPKEDLLSIKDDSFLDSSSTSSLEYVAGNCSTRRNSDRASITTENTFHSKAISTAESLNNDASAKSKGKGKHAPDSTLIGNKGQHDGYLKETNLVNIASDKIKPKDIESWTQSIVMTSQTTEPSPQQSATNVSVSTPKCKTWATVASNFSRNPSVDPVQEAKKSPAKVPSVIKAPPTPGLGPSWAGITKKTPNSTVDSVSSVVRKQTASESSPKEKENCKAVSIRRPPASSSKPTSHRTIFVTGLDPTNDQEYHREEILKIFADFKVHGISNRRKLDPGNIRASCFIDMETPEDAQRAIDMWPWPTDRIGGGLLHVARAKNESNRPLDYTVVKEIGEQHSRRKM